MGGECGIGEGGRGVGGTEKDRAGAEHRRQEEVYPCLGPYTRRPDSVGAWGKVCSNFVKSSPGDSKMQPCLTPACFSLRVTWPPPRVLQAAGRERIRSLLFKGSLGRGWESLVESSSDNPDERE